MARLRAPPPRPAQHVAARTGPYHPCMTTRPDLPPIRLTELTECGGCAAKLGADLLHTVRGLGYYAGVEKGGSV